MNKTNITFLQSTFLLSVVPTTNPVLERDKVPEPYGLQSCTNKQGLIVLSWKISPLSDDVTLLGFLLEYRIGGNIRNSSKNLVIKCGSSGFKKRRISTTRNKRSAVFGFKKSPMNSFNAWRKLAAYSANISKVEINRELLAQDQLYEIHILTVTPSAYSSASNSIFVSTQGEFFSCSNYGCVNAA